MASRIEGRVDLVEALADYLVVLDNNCSEAPSGTILNSGFSGELDRPRHEP